MVRKLQICKGLEFRIESARSAGFEGHLHKNLQFLWVGKILGEIARSTIS